MNQENTAKLFHDFPELFRDRDRTGMNRGFETGDGWLELIHELCRNVEAEALKAGISRTSDDWPKVQGVKEKFGTLRFYIWNRPNPTPGSENIYSESISKLIVDALDRSATTCEDPAA